MTQSLKYQADFVAKTDGLKQAQGEIKETGKQFGAIAQAGAGLGMAMSAASGAVRGNVGALMQLAMGAGIALRAISNLNPALRILTAVLFVGKLAYEAFTSAKEKAAQKAEEARRNIDALGLSISALDRHQRNVKDSAQIYERIEKAAERSAKAIRDMADAQIAYNTAVGNANQANIDLREAEELAGATTDEQRREIRGRYAVERNQASKETAQQEFELKKQAHLDERRNIVETAARQETNQRAMLGGNVTSARVEIADIIDQIAQEQTDALKPTSPYESERKKQSEAWMEKAAEMDQMRKDFAADPRAAAEKYADQLTGKAGDLGGLIKALESHQSALKDFEDSAPERADDVSKKLAEHAVKGATIGQGLKAATDSADATLTREKTALSAEEKAEQERLAAVEKERGRRVNQAKDRAASAVAADRYDRMSDTDKADHLRGQANETQSALAINAKAIAAEADPEKKAGLQIRQGQLIEELAATMKEGRSITGRIEKEKEREGKETKRRDDAISEHKKDIEEIRASRATTAMDTSQVFQHMYDVRGGKNPDEMVAANTKKIEEHNAAIRKLLESVGQS
ncbi:MAG TPA: hypothetical protein PKE26_11890 [Kiritimatiellia bacterium]|nr:hypothetical protein [Kiritimatiellia bacterium]HMO99802.1 hypothetical protein [Kiritimatiellia bacterium]HMP97219.1 hypothetical protein [Kiritimatiellia bacterium]